MRQRTRSESLSKRVALAIKMRLTANGSSVPKLVDAMPRDSLGRRYSYRSLTRKLTGEARMTIDDLEAICSVLGEEPHVLIAAAVAADQNAAA